MKIVHTTYFVTTVLFLMIATFLLTEQPLLPKDRQNLHTSPAIQETNNSKEEPKAVIKDPFAELPKVKVIATGYYAGVESTGKDKGHPQYGITYSGAKVVRDHYSTIAADLSVFPLGTILYIPDYGYGIVADIGSAIKGNKIDLYFDSKEDVYRKWGKKTVEVFVVKRGEGHVSDSVIADLNQKEDALAANSQIN